MARQPKQLVRLWRRANKNGGYTIYLRFTDLNGRRRCESLGHSDERKAEKQRLSKEKELRMNYCQPRSMRLQEFFEDSLRRTGDQIRESTVAEIRCTVKDFISVLGNIDFQSVTLQKAEYYRQSCLDRGNAKATVGKKLRHLKRLFQLAVNRKQIEENPFAHITMPKGKKKKIRVYSKDECHRILRAAKEYVAEQNDESMVRWDLLILIALETGMRRGELLNLCWGDIDFEEQEIDVTSKQNTAETWEWLIKDSDERTVPLSKEANQLLIKLQQSRPTGYPYVFVPPARYDYIQNEHRAKGKWSLSSSRLRVLNNFRRQFGMILRRAGIRWNGTFHDLRRTVLSRWLLDQRLSEYEVMVLAGHTSFNTTHSFYLAIKKEHLAKARQVSEEGLGKVLEEE